MSHDQKKGMKQDDAAPASLVDGSEYNPKTQSRK